MKQFLKQFALDIFKQLTGSNSRSGKLTISWYANVQMNDLHLDFNTIKDVFKNGRKSKALSKTTAIIQSQSATVGMRIKTSMSLPV
jgi:hypothetical protein